MGLGLGAGLTPHTLLSKVISGSYFGLGSSVALLYKVLGISRRHLPNIHSWLSADLQATAQAFLDLIKVPSVPREVAVASRKVVKQGTQGKLL